MDRDRELCTKALARHFGPHPASEVADFETGRLVVRVGLGDELFQLGLNRDLVSMAGCAHTERRSLRTRSA